MGLPQPPLRIWSGLPAADAAMCPTATVLASQLIKTSFQTALPSSARPIQLVQQPIQAPKSSPQAKAPKRKFPSESSQGKDPKRKFASESSQVEVPKLKVPSERCRTKYRKRNFPNERSQTTDANKYLGKSWLGSRRYNFTRYPSDAESECWLDLAKGVRNAGWN